MVECYYMCQSDNGAITASHALQQWSNAYISALDGIKDPRAPMQLQNLFNAAGFVEIESRMIPLPLCGWPIGKGLFWLRALPGFKRARSSSLRACCCRLMRSTQADPRQRQIGTANREINSKLLSSLAVYPFTERLGMSAQEYGILVARARADAANPSLRPYFPLQGPPLAIMLHAEC